MTWFGLCQLSLLSLLDMQFVSNLEVIRQSRRLYSFLFIYVLRML